MQNTFVLNVQEEQEWWTLYTDSNEAFTVHLAQNKKGKQKEYFTGLVNTPQPNRSSHVQWIVLFQNLYPRNVPPILSWVYYTIQYIYTVKHTM